jgi:hypothetical protein
MAKKPDDTPPATDDDQKFIQKVVGEILYYGRAVDSTVLHALNDTATTSASPTQQTLQATPHLLDYVETHPDAVLRYSRSGMILIIHSDASYLTATKGRSRFGGHFFLGNKPSAASLQMHNGVLLANVGILNKAMASSAEAETVGVYKNARLGTVLRFTLQEMGHPQEATPIETDNTTAHGILNGTVQQNRSRAMDMRFYWVQDRINQDQFRLLWVPGAANYGDYYTKHHSPTHHKLSRPLYVHTVNSPKSIPRVMRPSLRGCGDPSSLRGVTQYQVTNTSADSRSNQLLGQRSQPLSNGPHCASRRPTNSQTHLTNS